MAIEVGSTLPSVTLKYLTENGMQEITTDDIFKGKTVVMFAVPGAYTPVCSAKHLPGFVEQAAAFSAKGVDRIVCMAVNDPFVMKAWAKDQNVGDAVFMLPDGNGTLTAKLGLELDASGPGLGTRSQRFALVAVDGVVKTLAVDKAGTFELTSAEAILKTL